MEESSRSGTHFTAPLLCPGPCMLLTHLIWPDPLGNTQKHEAWWKHDHLRLSLSLSCSVFISVSVCLHGSSSCFLSSDSSASNTVTVGDKWRIMSNTERGRMRLMGVWNTVNAKVGPTTVTAEHGNCQDDSRLSVSLSWIVIHWGELSFSLCQHLWVLWALIQMRLTVAVHWGIISLERHCCSDSQGVNWTSPDQNLCHKPGAPHKESNKTEKTKEQQLLFLMTDIFRLWWVYISIPPPQPRSSRLIKLMIFQVSNYIHLHH